jgi:hypothetical protein
MKTKLYLGDKKNGKLTHPTACKSGISSFIKTIPINMYRVPMTRTEGAYAYIKATSIKEAQKKFNNDDYDHEAIVYDSEFGKEQEFEQDGKIEEYDTDVED